jgi:hypothetical protein
MAASCRGFLEMLKNQIHPLKGAEPEKSGKSDECAKPRD